MKITPITVTPELLATARHSVVYDGTQTSGNGIGVSAAPEVFGWDPNGRECVRFGRVLGLLGDFDATMPILPEVYESAVEAQESDPADVINIEPLQEGPLVLAAWRAYFKGQVRGMGNLAVDCLLNGWFTPLTERIKYRNGLQYIASVIDLERPVPGLEPTRYDNFDVLSFVGVVGANNIDNRRRVAAGLHEASLDISTGKASKLDTSILTKTVNELLSVPARSLR